MPGERPVRALITRPKEDCADIAAALRARAIEPVIEPLLRIAPVAATADLDGVQAVLLTSRNGARALAAATQRRDVPVLAVGDSTAALARELGFAAVESAGGDSVALAALARARLDAAAGPLFHAAGFHAAGSAVAGDLAAGLAENGFAVRREVLYEAQPVDRLSAGLRELLSRRRLDMALFFSPRTAKIFVGLADDAGLGAAATSMIAVCLSPAVRDAAAGLKWRAIATAARPDMDGLIAALDAARLQPEPEHPDGPTA